MLAWICGDVCIWKPSSKTPLCGVACQNIIQTVLERNNLPEGISCLVVGNESGDLINNDKRIPLVSFTGSTRIGRHVSKTVAERFGKTILELGGNNAIIVSQEADLSMVLVGAVFGAVGTAGQRCTSTRRLIVHESVYDKTLDVLAKAYAQLKIGNPLDANNHVGPLIDKGAVQDYLDAIAKAKAEGGRVIVEGGSGGWRVRDHPAATVRGWFSGVPGGSAHAWASVGRAAGATRSAHCPWCPRGSPAARRAHGGGNRRAAR
jgi:aldehyde dehydrogenase (NAD+)